MLGLTSLLSHREKWEVKLAARVTVCALCCVPAPWGHVWSPAPAATEGLSCLGTDCSPSHQNHGSPSLLQCPGTPTAAPGPEEGTQLLSLLSPAQRGTEVSCHVSSPVGCWGWWEELTQPDEPSLLPSPPQSHPCRRFYNPALTLLGVMQAGSVSEHYPPNSPLSAALPGPEPDQWGLVQSTSAPGVQGEEPRRGRSRVILLPGSWSTVKGFSVLHPSLFAFLAAGNSKVLPSAPKHAGMLQMWSRTCKSHPCLRAASGTRWTTWLGDSRYSQACLGRRTQPPPPFPAVLPL